MKNLIKEYYKMDDDIKDDLELLYIYQTLRSLFYKYGNIKINTIENLEKLMHIIQKCMIVTDFSADFIITNILEVLNSQNISVKDLYDLEIDDLLNILFTDCKNADENDDCQKKKILNDKDNGEIITEFTYKKYYCILCKNRNKYLVIFNNGNDTDTIILNSINDIFNGTLKRKLAELQ